MTHAGLMGASHRILAITLGKKVLLPLGVAAELGGWNSRELEAGMATLRGENLHESEGNREEGRARH